MVILTIEIINKNPCNSKQVHATVGSLFGKFYYTEITAPREPSLLDFCPVVS